jgi:hypothetical protein
MYFPLLNKYLPKDLCYIIEVYTLNDHKNNIILMSDNTMYKYYCLFDWIYISKFVKLNESFIRKI